MARQRIKLDAQEIKQVRETFEVGLSDARRMVWRSELEARIEAVNAGDDLKQILFELVRGR